MAVAGVDDTLCKNNPTATLKGVLKFAGGGIWKGGGGLFNPDRTTMNAKYTPTPAELTAGSVTLTLATTNNGVCGADSTKIKLTFSEPPQVFPEVSAYPSICANNLVIDLFGAVRPINKGFGITSFIFIRIVFLIGAYLILDMALSKLKKSFFWDLFLIVNGSILLGFFWDIIPQLGGTIGFEMNLLIQDVKENDLKMVNNLSEIDLKIV